MLEGSKISDNKFRLGVLICDHVNDLLRPEFGDYPGMFNRLFALVQDQYDFELIFFNVVDDEFPKNIDDCDAYLTSGSKSGVNDDDEWIAKLENFIRKLFKANRRFVGICFGHQLIAKALGGSVKKSKKGWGIGVHSSYSKTELINPPLPKRVNLIVSHQDQIQQLPKDTNVLYSSDFCPFSMIQIGENIIGMQGHPEFFPEYSIALMELRKEIIPSEVRRIAKLSLNNDIHSRKMVEWILNFVMKK